MHFYTFIFPISHAVNSHSKIRHIPIVVWFPSGYSYSHPISKHAEQNNKVYLQTVDSRAAGQTIPLKTGRQSLKNKITLKHHSNTQFFTGRMPFLPPNQQRQSTENTIQNTLKIRPKILQSFFKLLC